MNKLTKILTENYPLLWASQLVKMLLLFFIGLVVEYIVVLFMPVSASDYLVLFCPLVLFLAIIVYRTIQQNKYFEVNFSFKQVYILYILNVFIIILIGILILCFVFFMQSKINKLVKKDQFEHDVSVMRINGLGYENIRMLKTIIRYPDTKQTILKNQATGSTTPLTSNSFIVINLENNKPLFPFYALPSDTTKTEEKYYSSEEIVEKILAAESAPPDSFNLSVYDTGYFNIAALELVTRINEKNYDSLKNVASEILGRYSIPFNPYGSEYNTDADFDNMALAINQIITNSKVFDVYIDPDEGVLFLLILFIVIYIPVISIIASMGRRYQLNFKTFSFPLSYFSFITHLMVTVAVLVVSLNIDLFGNTGGYALLLLILAFFICTVICKRKKANVLLQSFFTQLLHYQLVYLLPVLFFWLFESAGVPYIVLYIANFVFIILINIYFFKQYYKLSYLPLK